LAIFSVSRAFVNFAIYVYKYVYGVNFKLGIIVIK